MCLQGRLYHQHTQNVHTHRKKGKVIFHILLHMRRHKSRFCVSPSPSNPSSPVPISHRKPVTFRSNVKLGKCQDFIENNRLINCLRREQSFFIACTTQLLAAYVTRKTSTVQYLFHRFLLASPSPIPLSYSITICLHKLPLQTDFKVTVVGFQVTKQVNRKPR